MTAEVLEVGYIVKAHGIKGEVIVALITNRLERVNPGARLFCRGLELTVQRSSPHQARYIVKFESVESRDAAENLRGEKLYAAPVRDDDSLWVDEMVGLAVEDQNGNVLGLVVALEANPASDLLVLDTGVLVPLTFVKVGSLHYSKSGKIVADVPTGLVEETK